MHADLEIFLFLDWDSFFLPFGAATDVLLGCSTAAIPCGIEVYSLTVSRLSTLFHQTIMGRQACEAGPCLLMHVQRASLCLSQLLARARYMAAAADQWSVMN